MMDSHIIYNSPALDLGVFHGNLVQRTGSTEERAVHTYYEAFFGNWIQKQSDRFMFDISLSLSRKRTYARQA